MRVHSADWASLYAVLFDAYGPQDWWPGAENPFEVVVGAILTQRTTWTNAAKAVDALRQAGMMSAEAIDRVNTSALHELIRQAGFYRAKAATLKMVCARAIDAGGLSTWLSMPKDALRDSLRSIRGIGDETADAILVYAASRPSFVVDAHTRRLLERLGWITGSESYAQVQKLFGASIPKDVELYSQWHALLVCHGKAHCRAKPRCTACPLLESCSFADRLEGML